MAKKRSKPKHSQNRQTDDPVQSIRDLLDRGKTKTALQMAKALTKSPTKVEVKLCSERESLLADAYAARIEALTSSGMAKEAEELLAVASQRLPAMAARWGEVKQAHNLRQDPMGILLPQWASLTSDSPADAEGRQQLRRELDKQLAEHCSDPRRIADAPELDESDPLRAAARVIHKAFVEAADGKLTKLTRADLAMVGRRSPLVPWRNFVLALAAYHRNDDQTTRQLLERIPEHTAPYRLANLLRVLLGDREHATITNASERRLLDQISRGATQLIDVSSQLNDSLQAGSAETSTRAIERLVAGLVTLDLRTAHRLVLWILNRQDWPDCAQQPRCQQALERALGQEFARLDAISQEFQNPFSALISWIDWLIPATSEKQRPLPKIELALVAERLAGLTDEAEDIIIEILAGTDIDVERRDLIDPQRTNELATTAMHRFRDLGYSMHSPGGATTLLLTLLTKLYDALHEAVGSPPEPWTRGREKLLAIACMLTPTADRFEVLSTQSVNLPVKYHKPILERWAERFPQDIEPWLRLITAASQRSALRQAETYLQRAEEIAPIDERVRAARFRILTDSFLLHLSNKKLHLCEKDLKKLNTTPAAASPERQTFLAAANCLVAEQQGKTSARQSLLNCTDSPEHAEAMIDLVQRLATKRRALMQLPALADNSKRINLLVQLLRVIRAVSPYAPGNRIRIDKALMGSRVTDLPSKTDDLVLLCEFFECSSEWDLLYLCSSAGLQAEESILPTFLAYRWACLKRVARWRKPAHDLARLALEFANRYERHEIIHKITTGTMHGQFATSFATVSKSEVAKILDRERRLPPRLGDRGKRPNPAPELPFGRFSSTDSEQNLEAEQ